jgi:hypothetical protein
MGGVHGTTRTHGNWGFTGQWHPLSGNPQNSCGTIGAGTGCARFWLGVHSRDYRRPVLADIEAILLLLADPTGFADRITPVPDMRTQALHLKEACPTTKHFSVYLFPKPSAIANFMPPWVGGDVPVPSEGYFDKYVGHLLGSGGITRAQMQQIDNWVENDLNPRIRSAFAPLGERVQFIDLYASAAMYDRKSGIETKTVFLRNGVLNILLDNHAMDITPFGGLGGFGGGLFGLDNLHPTIVGYGLIAQ